jgi:hypothetical protein
MKTRPDRRACILLAIGAVLGTVLGATSAFDPRGSGTDVPRADAVAVVNGRVIRTKEYLRTCSLLARDKRTDMTDADRARVLDRLIEEELLLQYGIEMGILDSERVVRGAITTAMMTSIVAESTSETPSESDLRAFHEENRTHFADPSGTVPDFRDVRDEVEEAYRNRARSRSLRDYIDWLREEAEIVVSPEAGQ